MKCPHDSCGAWSRVLSTRNLITRRRECANGHRFTTTEVVKLESNDAQVIPCEAQGASPLQRQA